MKKGLLAELVQSIEQAGQIRKGQREPSRVFTSGPVDVTRIRRRLRVSQSQFALLLGVSKATLQNWEQGRRQPEGPAKALLRVVDKNPKAVLEALHG